MGKDKSHRSLGGLCRTRDKFPRLVKHELNNSKNAFVIMHGVNLPQYIDEVFANITMFRNTWGAHVLAFSEGRRGPLQNLRSVFFFNNN
jgi:hypothetical protein